MSEILRPFDAADYLHDQGDDAAFLAAAVEEGDDPAIMGRAWAAVTRAMARRGHLLPLPGAGRLLVDLRAALGFPAERRPLVIGVDGRWGVGKSSLAAWLSWQLGMPAISLDLYMVRDSSPLEWRVADLERVISARLSLGRPVIVEGICLCRVLQAVDRDPDYLVWVEKAGDGDHSPEDPAGPYVREFQPRERAEHVLQWGDLAQQDGAGAA